MRTAHYPHVPLRPKWLQDVANFLIHYYGKYSLCGNAATVISDLAFLHLRGVPTTRIAQVLMSKESWYAFYSKSQPCQSTLVCHELAWLAHYLHFVRWVIDHLLTDQTI